MSVSAGHGLPPNNLPHFASTFVGRQTEVLQVSTLLADSRLLTLTGPAGVGKTRLAREVAGRSAYRYPDGVWLIDLTSVVDASRLSDSIARVVPQASDRPVSTSDDVAGLIGRQRVLLVLDNCERLVEPCAHLVEYLLRVCPAADVLTTTRERLGVRGERVWITEPLSLPDRERPGAHSVRSSESGELFLHRALETDPRFRLTDAVAAPVSEICHRLDGIPLAIELAALRLSSLTCGEILERLEDWFRFLSFPGGTVPSRQQSLLAALDWSHDLLAPAEAALLRRVSVFAGWTLAAAEEVCVGRPVERAALTDLHADLVRKSLVVAENRTGAVRYSLLETVRVWLEAKLEAAAEGTSVQRAHASWCLRLAERVDEDLRGYHRKAALDELDAEHDNLRAALEWARAADDLEIGLRLATALARFWRLRGHRDEARLWLNWAVVAGARAPAPLLAKTLRAAGLMRGSLGDIGSALPLLEKSSSLYAEAGDDEASLCACNPAFQMIRRPDHALPVLEKRAAFCRRTGDTKGLAHLLFLIGQAHYIAGAVGDARRHFEGCVQLGRGAADGEALRSGLFGLARVDLLVGDLISAQGWAAEARLLADEADDPEDGSEARARLADVARLRGQWDMARNLLTEADDLARRSGVPLAVACSLYSFGRLAESLGNLDAGALFEESLSVAGPGELPISHQIRCRVGIGAAAEASCDMDRAEAELLDAAKMAEEVGDVVPGADALYRLSLVASRRGLDVEATTLAQQSLARYHLVGALPGVASSLELLAGLAGDGRSDAAVRLFAAAHSLRETQGYARSVPEQARFERELARVRCRFEGEAFQAAWAEGTTLSVAEAVAYATRGRRGGGRPASGWESLTPAEREVVRLVADGLSNPDIGRRLFISPRTVGHHLAHVYDKLGIRSRGALIKDLAGRTI